MVKQAFDTLRRKLKKQFVSMLALNKEGLISPHEFYDIFANVFQRLAEKKQL